MEKDVHGVSQPALARPASLTYPSDLPGLPKVVPFQSCRADTSPCGKRGAWLRSRAVWDRWPMPCDAATRRPDLKTVCLIITTLGPRPAPLDRQSGPHRPHPTAKRRWSVCGQPAGLAGCVALVSRCVARWALPGRPAGAGHGNGISVTRFRRPPPVRQEAPCPAPPRPPFPAGLPLTAARGLAASRPA